MLGTQVLQLFVFFSGVPRKLFPRIFLRKQLFQRQNNYFTPYTIILRNWAISTHLGKDFSFRECPHKKEWRILTKLHVGTFSIATSLSLGFWVNTVLISANNCLGLRIIVTIVSENFGMQNIFSAIKGQIRMHNIS